MIVSEGSIFSNKFSKNSLKFNFSTDFSSNTFQIFQKISQQFVFSSKISETFGKFFWKIC